tara:strand:- start:126 stop:932 length:807 start_codon:yes stop_codon:yes gene_type:complete
MAFNLKYKNVKRSGSNGRFTLGATNNMIKKTPPLKQNGEFTENNQKKKNKNKNQRQSNIEEWDKVFKENPNLSKYDMQLDYEQISPKEMAALGGEYIPDPNQVPGFNEKDVMTWNDVRKNISEFASNPTMLNPTRSEHKLIRGYYFDEENATEDNPDGKTYWDEAGYGFQQQISDKDGNVIVNYVGGGELFEQTMRKNNAAYYDRLAEFANVSGDDDKAKAEPHKYGPYSNAAIILKRTGRTEAQMNWLSKEDIAKLPPEQQKLYDNQ